jgi:hypothetical protein
LRPPVLTTCLLPNIEHDGAGFDLETERSLTKSERLPLQLNAKLGILECEIVHLNERAFRGLSYRNAMHGVIFV